MRAAIRVVAGLFAALWALPGFGLVDLAVTVNPDAEWLRVSLLDGGWGLLVTAFIVAGLALVMLRPVWATEIAAQLAGIAAVIVISAIAGGEYTVWWMVLALVVPAGALAGLAALARRRDAPVPSTQAERNQKTRVAARPAPGPASLRWAHAGLAALGAPWLAYAIDMYRANRETRPPTEITNDVNHWAIQGAFAVVLVGFAVLAAVRPTLRRFNAVRVGICAAYFGISSLRLSEAAAGLSPVWATLAIVWGVALLVVAGVPRRAGRPA